MTQKLGNGFEFIKKACFVCGSLNHLIKDCNFYENKRVEKFVLNNIGRVTSQREIRSVWNNAQRVNHQNKISHPHPKRNFVPTAVVTKSGQVPVNTAKQISPRVAASISTARPVNTAAPKSKVNDALLKTYSYFKAHSPVRMAFNQKSAAKTNNFNKKVYTAKVTTAGPKAVVSTAEGKRENAVKSSDQGIFDSGCSRHMTGIFENDDSCVACQKGKQHKASSRTMLADLLLPTTFWVEEVNTACYVQNRVLVTKPHNKTPYELLLGRPPSISFMRPFGCPVTILNTLDPLGKFDGKADEGFLVGYSINSKAFRVFNTRTRKVDDNLHINFLENKPSVAGSGPEWLFDIDSLTKSMNYEPITAGNQTNGDTVIETNVNASSQSTYIKDADEVPGKGDDDLSERNEGYANNTNIFSTINPSVSAAGQGFDNVDNQERIDSSSQDVNTA
ncbi:ribonuclease H-like domain-containing protein [Tanacetum coccineum]